MRMARARLAPSPGATLSSMTAAVKSQSKNATLKQTGLTTGAKIRVANLDLGVTTADIEELFGEIGTVKSAEVVTNQAGAAAGPKKRLAPAASPPCWVDGGLSLRAGVQARPRASRW